MDEKPSDADKDLLQRLNALKPSTIQLEPNKLSWDLGGPSDDDDDDDDRCEDDKPDADEVDLLSARFKNLGGIVSHAVPGQPEEDVEDLLADLRSRETWKLEHELQAENEIKSLVDEAKKFLLRGGDEAIARRLESPSRCSNHISEEKEAEDYIQNVLDELRTPDFAPDDHPKESPGADPLAESRARTDNEEKNGRELSDTLDLPCVPISNPTTYSPKALGNRRNIFTEPDESEPTWCCICSDDAKLKCLDCYDLPLFCPRCWKEMHLVEGNADERGHRAVEFRRTAMEA
ncbi:hypothetical protein D8B26_001077 [Coccidioides posadasii str. Silveira]|nr:hypothetical protein CPAG_00607 [Coccidioides posadasii RMSCC 3488]QVM06364.1 hypothetical protein D8B26_001077 [Coccidioides posadasii str. Silveira]